MALWAALELLLLRAVAARLMRASAGLPALLLLQLRLQRGVVGARLLQRLHGGVPGAALVRLSNALRRRGGCSSAQRPAG